ncbi:hypothetical protein N7530_003916 [Penicillium desertorum]|uniref:Uncharacterized protein n=1 Tax=Penicillium desertorum TaxID=1303715 RepID=A0A9W9WXD9_9EURO|nr:hypothetical protein N7530_003916 [Penicillium desertorum]
MTRLRPIRSQFRSFSIHKSRIQSRILDHSHVVARPFPTHRDPDPQQSASPASPDQTTGSPSTALVASDNTNQELPNENNENADDNAKVNATDNANATNDADEDENANANDNATRTLTATTTPNPPSLLRSGGNGDADRTTDRVTPCASSRVWNLAKIPYRRESV